MFRINKLTDYSVVLLDALHADKADCTSAKCLSERSGVPLPTVSKILKLLSAQGLLAANRGPQGGYSLAIPLDQLPLMTVIEAMEGELSLTTCIDQGCSCEQIKCRMKPGWERVNQQLYEVLRRITVAEMIRPTKEVEQERPLRFYSHAINPLIIKEGNEYE